jgi:hypothetical protein
VNRVFGKVIHGMEHIEAIGRLETDSKDRPLNKVVISHCGELELRKPPPARRASTPPSIKSDSDSEAEERREKRRRKSKRETSEERRERRLLKKEKKSKSKSKSKSKKDGEEETIEELDARLEREEKERLETLRVEKEEAVKKERERRIAEGGVVYKGTSASWVRTSHKSQVALTMQDEDQCDSQTQRQSKVAVCQPISIPDRPTLAQITTRIVKDHHINPRDKQEKNGKEDSKHDLNSKNKNRISTRI